MKFNIKKTLAIEIKNTGIGHDRKYVQYFVNVSLVKLAYDKTSFNIANCIFIKGKTNKTKFIL